MQFQYTPKFEEALASIELFQKDKKHSDDDVRAEFVKKMLELGWLERIQNLYCVFDKLSGKFVQFVPNKSQMAFLLTKKRKNIILKCRQVGFTTLSCIYALDRALWDKWRTGIMAHKQETVKTIFQIVKYAYTYFKKHWGQFYNPKEEQNNVNRLSWSDLKSSLTVAYDFQGLTVSFLHNSEAAFTEGERMTNSLQSVPETGEVTLESTPNGRGGQFYDIWQEWKKFGEGAPYQGFFIPWHQHYPECPDRWIPAKRIEWLPKETELKERYNLQDSHLLWRRDKIRGDCGGSEERFDNQYPSDDVSCFLSGESNVFPKSTLEYQERFISEPSFTGFFKLDNKTVSFIPDKVGTVRLYRVPQAGNTYSIGADPSGGSGKDAGCAIVLDQGSGEQVAELYGFLDPDIFADELYKLGQYYNCGWICIEANNHGHAVILKLKDKYFNLYRKQQFNNVTKSVSNEIGFLTTANSKITITDNLGAALRDGQVKVKSNALLSELSCFVNVARKMNDGRSVMTQKREALPGAHDDRVMSLALAYEMMRTRPASSDTTGPNYSLGMIADPDTGFLVPESGYGSFDDYSL